MRTTFDVITTFDGDPFEFEKLINDMLLMDVFGNLYAVYATSKAHARKAVLYVMYAYSKHSMFVTMGESRSKVKQRAAEKAELNEDMRNELVDFEFTYHTKPKKAKGKAVNKGEVDEIEEDDGTGELEASNYNVSRIIECIKKWMEYQNDRVLTHLMRLYDHYEQVSSAAVSMPVKNNTVDWDMKAKCQDQANKLMKEIAEWEIKLDEEQSVLKPAAAEIKDVERKISNTVRVESVI